MTAGEIVITIFIAFVSTGFGAMFWRRMDRMDDRFDRLEATMDTWFGQVDNRFAQVDDRFDRLEARMDSRFGQIEVRFGAIGDRMAALQSDLTHVAGCRCKATQGRGRVRPSIPC